MIRDEFPQPGHCLPREAELAERFSVSRIVIREAMKILEERGVVEVQAGRGTFTVNARPDRVKESLLRLFRDQPIPSFDDMERMMELRQVLEETLAGLAAVRATREDLAGMAAALEAMEKGGSEAEGHEADLRFHAAVAHAAHNPYFEIVIGPLTDAFLQQIKLTNSSNMGVPLHREIYEAIKATNPVASRQAVRRLMKATIADARRALNAMTAPSLTPR